MKIGGNDIACIAWADDLIIMNESEKVEFKQFDPQNGIFEGYIGWGLLQQQPLGTNRVSQNRMFT